MQYFLCSRDLFPIGLFMACWFEFSKSVESNSIMTCQIGTSLCCQYCNDLLQAGNMNVVIQMVLKGSPILNHSVTFGDFLSGIQNTMKWHKRYQTVCNGLLQCLAIAKVSPPKNLISKIQDDFGIKWVGFCRFSHEGEDGEWRRQEVFCRGARRQLWWGYGVFREQLLVWR